MQKKIPLSSKPHLLEKLACEFFSEPLNSIDLANPSEGISSSLYLLESTSWAALPLLPSQKNANLGGFWTK